jgi:hypothetical protein
MKKTPRELELEELLKALEGTTDAPAASPTDYHNDVLAFLSHYNIQNGPEKVSKTLIKKIYNEWSENPISKDKLENELTKLLQSDARYYHLNQRSINLAASAYKYLSENKTIKKVKSPHYKKHFETYLNHYGIKRGKVWIPVFVLFHLYDKWIYGNKRNRGLTKDYFQQFCNLYFERKRVDMTYYWYGVDETIYNHITKEQVIDMINTRKLYGKKTKGINQKKKTVESS